MLGTTTEELLDIVTGRVQLWELAMVLGGVAGDGQRAAEDTEGSWWHPGLASPVGLLSKPVF